MTGFVLIGCTAILTLGIITATTICAQAWERVRTHAADQWLTAQREGLAQNARANKQMMNLVRDHVDAEGDQDG